MKARRSKGRLKILTARAAIVRAVFYLHLFTVQGRSDAASPGITSSTRVPGWEPWEKGTGNSPVTLR
jgi:hypothetical protein